MSRRAILGLAVAGLISAIAGQALYSAWIGPPPTPASALRFTDLAGKPRDLSEWRGRWVLVNFWATWCAPCLSEIPLLMDAQEAYADRGLQIVGPAMDRSEPVRALVQRMGIPYPVFAGDVEVAAAMDGLGDTLGALPFSVLLSPDGTAVYRKHGDFSRDELTALLEQYLQ